MTKSLGRGALLFLVGAGIGAAILWGCGVRWRLHTTSAKACTGCPRPEAVPEREDEVGHVPLGPPLPGEWRFRFKEAPQSFEDYRTGPLNAKCAHRTTFYLQPLGEAGTRYRETLERMRIYAEAFFGVPAKVLDPIPLFEDTYSEKRKQYDAEGIIDRLSQRIPPDALVYMGIAEKDLYVPDLNFVFGVGHPGLRCGAYSLTRYETEDVALFTRRSLKLLAHEAGHIVSINHCVTYSCVMQGANSLPEDDSHPMHLCPIDLQKVLWNGGQDRAARYRKLASLYREWGLPSEALWATDKSHR
jgi:archaemetzincin